MSVNINFRQTTNETKWNGLKNGDFAVVEGNQQHPLPPGLYRVFKMDQEVPLIDPNAKQYTYVLLPMFEGPFPEGMFPYMLTEGPFPTIKQIVTKVHIEVEVS
jgi:hypothetical protein